MKALQFQLDNHFIVKTTGSNRFFVFNPTAFFIIRKMIEGTGIVELISEYQQEYGLTPVQAEHDVEAVLRYLAVRCPGSETDGQGSHPGSDVLSHSGEKGCTETACENQSPNAPTREMVSAFLKNHQPTLQQNILIHDKSFTIRFYDKEIKQSFAPCFVHLTERSNTSIQKKGPMSPPCFDLFRLREWYVLSKSPDVVACEDSLDRLQASVLEAIAGIVHPELKPMAVIHAAGIGNERYAVLLTGESGCGKSTLAEALISRGSCFLNDDIVPLDCMTGQAFGLPTALKIKRERIKYVPPPQKSYKNRPKSLPVKYIIVPQYRPDSETLI
ncbi:hypothetical protein BVY01_04645, partial [bacterium I07]